jgi:hypothetical protein
MIPELYPSISSLQEDSNLNTAKLFEGTIPRTWARRHKGRTQEPIFFRDSPESLRKDMPFRKPCKEYIFWWRQALLRFLHLG